MDEFTTRLVEAEHRLRRVIRGIETAESEVTRLGMIARANDTNPVPIIGGGGGGGGGSSWVSTCQIRLISHVHFPGLTPATSTDWNTPSLLRYYNTGTGSCGVLMNVDNPTFGYALMQWLTLTYLNEDATYVRWQYTAGTLGTAGYVTLRKSDWAIQGAMSYADDYWGAGIQSLFAINWQKDTTPSARMGIGTSGSATLNRATTPTIVSQITVPFMTNQPEMPGFVYKTLVEYLDTVAPTCSWGGTNPVFEVSW